MHRSILLLLLLVSPAAAAPPEKQVPRKPAPSRGRVNLRGAHRPFADFRNADLRGADLSGGYFRGANFTGADLRGANLEGADFAPAAAIERGARPLIVTVVGCVLLIAATGFTFRKITGGSGRYASPDERKLGFGCLGCGAFGVVMFSLLLLGPVNQSQLTEADLTGADLRRANLSGAWLRNTCLRDADLTGANLERAKLWLAYLPGARIAGARLHGAELNWAYRPENDLDRGLPKTDTTFAGEAYWDAMPESERSRLFHHTAETAPGVIRPLLGAVEARDPDKPLDAQLPMLSACRALGSARIRIRGRLLIWVINPDRDEEPIPEILPGELQARRSDPAFTVFIFHYRRDLVGSYGSGSGYRRDTDVYALTWPDRRPLGFITIQGEPPPEAVTHRSGERVGTVYGEYTAPQIRWLRALPRGWTHFLRFPPNGAPKRQ